MYFVRVSFSDSTELAEIKQAEVNPFKHPCWPYYPSFGPSDRGLPPVLGPVIMAFHRSWAQWIEAATEPGSLAPGPERWYRAGVRVPGEEENLEFIQFSRLYKCTCTCLLTDACKMHCPHADTRTCFHIYKYAHIHRRQYTHAKS